MKIELNTDNLSDLDRSILIAVVETINSGKAPAPARDYTLERNEESAAQLAQEQAAEAAAAAAPAPKKRQPKAAPAPEPEVPTSEEAGTTGEDLLAPADSATPEPAALTMADVVSAATPLISGGKQDQVKAILTDFGVGRVSALTEDQFDAFVTALKAL